MTTENKTACKQITLSDAYMSGQCYTSTNIVKRHQRFFDVYIEQEKL